MSCVIDRKECPQCHNEAVLEYNCRTYETWVQCPFCGYHSKIVTLRDRKGSDDSIPPLKLTREGKIMQRFYERKGYGAYCLTSKSGSGMFGSVDKKSVDDETRMISRFRKVFKKPEVDSKRSYLTKWDEDKQRLVFLVGSKEICDSEWDWGPKA